MRALLVLAVVLSLVVLAAQARAGYPLAVQQVGVGPQCVSGSCLGQQQVILGQQYLQAQPVIVRQQVVRSYAAPVVSQQLIRQQSLGGYGVSAFSAPVQALQYSNGVQAVQFSSAPNAKVKFKSKPKRGLFGFGR